MRNLHAEVENAQLLGNKAEMRRKYVAIHTGNQLLLNNNQIRNANYQSLMNALKQVNLHIQHSAKCRGIPFHFNESVENNQHSRSLYCTLYYIFI